MPWPPAALEVCATDSWDEQHDWRCAPTTGPVPQWACLQRSEGAHASVPYAGPAPLGATRGAQPPEAPSGSEAGDEPAVPAPEETEEAKVSASRYDMTGPNERMFIHKLDTT